MDTQIEVSATGSRRRVKGAHDMPGPNRPNLLDIVCHMMQTRDPQQCTSQVSYPLTTWCNRRDSSVRRPFPTRQPFRNLVTNPSHSPIPTRPQANHAQAS
jgi:hypothetical protein